MKKPNPQILLASSSPRRREFLQLLGIPFTAISPQNRERKSLGGKSPQAFVKDLAREKALWALKNRHSSHPNWILAADTVVLCPVDRVHSLPMGKPRNRMQAQRFLEMLSGRVHQVITGYCLLDTKNPRRPRSGCVETWVKMRSLGRKEIRAYLHSGEWRDKAGGYGIQGKGAFLVDSVEGSFTNVVGLPLQEILAVLTEAGVTRNGRSNRGKKSHAR